MKIFSAIATVVASLSAVSAVMGPIAPIPSQMRLINVPGSFCKLTIAADNAMEVSVIDGTAVYGVYFTNIPQYMAEEAGSSASALPAYRWQYQQTIVLPFYRGSSTAAIQLMVYDDGGFIAKTECTDGSSIFLDATGAANSHWQLVATNQVGQTVQANDTLALCPSSYESSVWGLSMQGGVKWVGVRGCVSAATPLTATYRLPMNAVNRFN